MIVRSTRRLSVSFLVLSLPLCFVGCSGSSDELAREPVTGTVTLDSQPLPSGSVSFIPAGGGPGAGGASITDGRFSIAQDVGLPPGNYSVVINSSKKRDDATKPDQVGHIKPSDLPKELIPAKYNYKTELKIEIKKGGGNDLKFALESK